MSKGKYKVMYENYQGNHGIINATNYATKEEAVAGASVYVGNQNYAIIRIVKEVLELRPKKEMDIVELE